jgi:hypothetical protein
MQISSPADFAAAVLAALGAPQSPANVQTLVAWEAAEGGNWHNTAWYNPLNTTLREPGSSSMNPVGVQAYTDWQQGVDATVSTLQEAPYRQVVADLAASAPPSQTAADVGASPWGTSAASIAGALGAGGYPVVPTAPHPGGSALKTQSVGIPLLGSAEHWVRNLVIEGAFLFLGVGLVGLGAMRFSQPLREKVQAQMPAMAATAAAL